MLAAAAANIGRALRSSTRAAFPGGQAAIRHLRPRLPAVIPALSSALTQGLKDTLVDHAAGNYRVLMNLSDELLAVAVDRQLPVLDEKLYFDAFTQTAKPKPIPKKRTS